MYVNLGNLYSLTRVYYNILHFFLVLLMNKIRLPWVIPGSVYEPDYCESLIVSAHPAFVPIPNPFLPFPAFPVTHLHMSIQD